MKLFCKELKGSEVTIDGVNDDTTVGAVKQQIETKLSIPGEFQ